MTIIDDLTKRFYHESKNNLKVLEGQAPEKNTQYIIERNGKFEAWGRYINQPLHKVQVCDTREKAEHWLDTALKFLKLTRRDVPLRHFKGN